MLPFSVAVVGYKNARTSLDAIHEIDFMERLVVVPAALPGALMELRHRHAEWLHQLTTRAQVVLLAPPSGEMTDVEQRAAVHAAAAYTSASWILVLAAGEYITPETANGIASVIAEVEGSNVTNLAVWVAEKTEWQTRVTCPTVPNGASVRVNASVAMILSTEEPA